MADVREWRKDVDYARERLTTRERVDAGFRVASGRLRRVLESSTKVFLNAHGHLGAQNFGIRKIMHEISRYTFDGDPDLAIAIARALRETSGTGHNPEFTESPSPVAIRNWIEVTDRWLQVLEQM